MGNCVLHWNKLEKDRVKDISKGKEITFFYLNFAKSMNQLALKEKFGFQCKCRVCRGHVDDQDSIIEKIAKIFMMDILYYPNLPMGLQI